MKILVKENTKRLYNRIANDECYRNTIGIFYILEHWNLNNNKFLEEMFNVMKKSK